MKTAGAEDRDPLFTAANLMSLSRVLMGAAVWLSPASRQLLLSLMALAAISDILDGWLARRSPGRAGPGGIGEWLDPVCDKAFVIAVLAALAVALETPPWQLLLVATRELLQLPLLGAHFVARRRLELVRLDYRAGVPGKITTVSQFAAIAAIVMGLGMAPVLCVVAGALGVLSAGYYVRRAIVSGDRALVAR